MKAKELDALIIAELKADQYGKITYHLANIIAARHKTVVTTTDVRNRCYALEKKGLLRRGKTGNMVQINWHIAEGV